MWGTAQTRSLSGDRLSRMHEPLPERYICPNGHFAFPASVTSADFPSVFADTESATEIRELPGRLGRGYVCATCLLKMTPAPA
jgi:hypothetical protein